MNILFLMLFYVLCFALDVAIIKHQRWLNHYKPGFRTGLIFSILVLPSFLIAIKISNQYFSETLLYNYLPTESGLSIWDINSRKFK